MATTTTKKTATSKPAAKKTTTAAKPAVKKATTAAKPAAKKTTTTASKPAVKKATTAAKSTEISVNGNKKILTLKKDFNKAFPYLSIRICYPAAIEDFKRLGICHEVQDYHTIAEVRWVESKGDISIAPNKKIKTLEQEFIDKLGLFAKVCYRKSSEKYCTAYGPDVEKTLSTFNEMVERVGGIKGAWK